MRRKPSAGVCWGGPWLAWLWLCRGELFIWENRADFIKQSSVLEALGFFHYCLRAWLPLFFSWLQNVPGFVPVWIPPVLLRWETGRGESLSELKPGEQRVRGRGTLSPGSP